MKFVAELEDIFIKKRFKKLGNTDFLMFNFFVAIPPIIHPLNGYSIDVKGNGSQTPKKTLIDSNFSELLIKFSGLKLLRIFHLYLASRYPKNYDFNGANFNPLYYS